MANFTEKAIKASFLKLLNERPLTKITVRADNIMKKYPSISS